MCILKIIGVKGITQTKGRCKMTDEAYHEFLATTLAEKLCFRVDACIEWVKEQEISTEQLIALLYKIGKEGVLSDFCSKLLVVFLNRQSLEELYS